MRPMRHHILAVSPVVLAGGEIRSRSTFAGMAVFDPILRPKVGNTLGSSTASTNVRYRAAVNCSAQRTGVRGLK
jgi:hypothetical protein